MIKVPNYTQIPNDYFEVIMQTLNGSENIVLLAIMRKTFGWQKTKDKISYTQLEKMTGIGSYSTIKKALSALEEKGLIISEKSGKYISYEINIETTTETVDVENNNDYRNCSDTITETVVIKPKTTTETVDTKESNLNKLSKEIYIEIDNIYVEAYKEVKGSDPTIIYPSLRKRQKTLLESGITKEKLISAIKEAKHDTWIVSHGFDILTILSDKVLPRLINTSRYALPSKTSFLTKKTTCPRCGSEVIAGLCTKCRTPVDSDGKELK